MMPLARGYHVMIKRLPSPSAGGSPRPGISVLVSGALRPGISVLLVSSAPGPGICVLLVLGALVKAKRCGQELSTVAHSDSDSSVWTFSIAGGLGSPEIMRPPSYEFISSFLGLGAWDVLVMG